MSAKMEIFIGRALAFSFGMALLLFSVYAVILDAAWIVADPTKDINIITMALVEAVPSWIGSLLVFLGWPSKQNR